MTIQWPVLAALLTLAVWYDWRQRRIPNRMLLGFAAVALGLSLLPGGAGAASALAAALLGGLAFWPFYRLGGMGGGDVKLMATTGLLVGIEQMVALCLAVALSGGVLAMGWWWHLRRRRRAAHQAHGPHTNAGLSSLVSRPLPDRMPYALAIAAGTLTHGLLQTPPGL